MAPNLSIGDLLTVRSITDIGGVWQQSLIGDPSTLVILLAALTGAATANRLAMTAAVLVLAARLAGMTAGLIAPGQLVVLLLLIDAGLLLAMLSLAMFSRPCWILFAAAFQLLEFGTRALAMIFPGWPAEPPLQIWSWALALGLLAGSLGRLTECRLLSRDRRSPLM